MQIRENRTTVPPPRELHPVRSHPMAWFWRSARASSITTATRTLYAWDANGNRRDLGQDQRYLFWRPAMEHSDEWSAKRRAIRDEANRKRSEAD